LKHFKDFKRVRLFKKFGSFALSDTQEDFPSLAIDIIGDVTCPWCFLGKRLIDAVVVSMPRLTVELRWHPFEIEPELPPGGMDYLSHLIAEVGPGKVGVALGKMAKAGREFGLDLDIGNMPRLQNSFAAHRLIRYASDHGVQPQVVERLFQAHFCDRRDISSLNVLCDVASQSQLDPKAASAFLRSDDGAAALRREMKDTRKSGVDMVPHFTFGGTIEVVGLQSADVFADALFNAIPEG
jgi:predicted DsbA family dithiol-disulfide isomerase